MVCKGAPEAVLARRWSTPTRRGCAETGRRGAASWPPQGLRVLAVARRWRTTPPAPGRRRPGCGLLGLVGDRRPAARRRRRTIAGSFADAGHPAGADHRRPPGDRRRDRAVSSASGADGDPVVTGDDGDPAEADPTARVFARIRPEQKLDIIAGAAGARAGGGDDRRRGQRRPGAAPRRHRGGDGRRHRGGPAGRRPGAGRRRPAPPWPPRSARAAGSTTTSAGSCATPSPAGVAEIAGDAARTAGRAGRAAAAGADPLDQPAHPRAARGGARAPSRPSRATMRRPPRSPQESVLGGGPGPASILVTGDADRGGHASAPAWPPPTGTGPGSRWSSWCWAWPSSGWRWRSGARRPPGRPARATRRCSRRWRSPRCLQVAGVLVPPLRELLGTEALTRRDLWRRARRSRPARVGASPGPLAARRRRAGGEHRPDRRSPERFRLGRLDQPQTGNRDLTHTDPRGRAIYSNHG